MTFNKEEFTDLLKNGFCEMCDDNVPGAEPHTCMPKVELWHDLELCNCCLECEYRCENEYYEK